MNTYFDNSCEYAAQVNLWSEKLTGLMKKYDNAAEAILAYYLPGHSEFLTCPLGVDEFKRETPCLNRTTLENKYCRS